MARQMGQSISKTAALVGHSCCAVVCIYQKWYKEGTTVNWWQGHGSTWGVKAGLHGPIQQTSYCCSNCWRSECWFWKVSEYTMHHSLVCMGLHTCGPVRVPMLTHVHHQKQAPGWTMGRRLAGGGNVNLWPMFCWETLGSAIHVDVTLEPRPHAGEEPPPCTFHASFIQLLFW